MKINIQSIAFTLRKEVSDFIQNKVKKLTDFIAKSLVLKFLLKLINQYQENKICRIRLIIPGNDMLSVPNAKLLAATAQAVEALERQIEKGKQKY